MSSGLAPTVLARMSSVSTSHSFSRFGYCLAESSLRGTSPDPDLAAVPSTVLVQPVSIVSTDTAAIRPASALRPWKRLIWHSQSIGGGAPCPRDSDRGGAALCSAEVTPC